MGLFSNSGKNKQGAPHDEPSFDDSAAFSGADDDAIAAQARAKRASSAGDAAPRRPRPKSAADPILPEKKRARRRLVGAVALALAVAVGLPMLLDSEPKPLSADIDIRIPSKEPVAAAPVGAAAPADDALDASEEIVAPAVAARDVATVAPAAAKPELKMLPKEELEPKPAAKPAEKPADKPAPRVEKPLAKPADPPPAKPAPAKPVDEAARALAILEGKPVAADGQKYVVQVASLASQEKVDELRARLSAAGFSSYTQKVMTREGELIRVRVGSPASKEVAEKMRTRLDALGLGGTVVPR